MQVPEEGDFASAGVVEGDQIISVNGVALRFSFKSETSMKIFYPIFEHFHSLPLMKIFRDFRDNVTIANALSNIVGKVQIFNCYD